MGLICVVSLFIFLPWIILHYVTKWKTAATLTTGDEALLYELYRLARRLEDRMTTVERLVAADHPDFRPLGRSAAAEAEGSRTMNRHRTKFYRDKANGKFMGVCAGIADYIGIEVLWIRLAFVVLTLSGIGGGPTVILYFALGFLAENKPQSLYADVEEQKFWQGVRQSPARTAREVRATFRDIDRRLAEVEAVVIENNVTEFVLSKAKVVEKAISFDDLMAQQG
eukprot:gene33845-43427_t